MPGKVKVRIVAARDLPVMDRTSDLADAFVEVRLGNVMNKTEVCKKTLNPQWDSEWFRFEVDDEELQDEPLQIRIMDYDTVTAHDAIGKVNISLGPLLTQDPPGCINGWFPIYDTMHGIRGELHIIVKVDFFVDSNKFRQTSCGVQFFYTCSIPAAYKALAMQGFVEELVVNDDPEYQWIDKIRRPRSSNEARQRIFTKLSGELQRKIGLKVLELGGNAVVGYHQCFDLEGEYGIVVRGIGTSVLLARVPNSSPATPTNPLNSSGHLGSAALVTDTGFIFPDVSQSASRNQSVRRQRKSSSDSDHNEDSPPRGEYDPTNDARELQQACTQLNNSAESSGNSTPFHIAKSVWPRLQNKQKNIDQLDLPFFTMTRFPPGFLCHLGGVVTARSVKLLDTINHPDEPETRDAWWSEVRNEIKSHARALGCYAVVGYYETASISDELVVLSATGTAACVDLNLGEQSQPPGLLATMPKSALGPSSPSTDLDAVMNNDVPDILSPPVALEDLSTTPPSHGCGVCHIPYSDTDLPFPISLSRCNVCRHHKVPDVLFATIEPPMDTCITGKGSLLQARVCRTKKKEKGEANADIVSTVLPFLEYELHQQLINKMKVKGMNALFGLHLQICVGETLLIGIASATAVYLSALPPPPILKVSGKRSSSDDDKRLTEIQKQILETTNKNKVRFKIADPGSLGPTPPPSPTRSPSRSPSQATSVFSPESSEPLNDLDLTTGGRDAFVVEVDDKKDEDIVAVLLDPPAPEGFFSCNTETLPGISWVKTGVQMVTAVQRHAISDEEIRTNQQFAKMFEDTLGSFWFKLRRHTPCCVCNLRFDVEIPEDDNIQFAVSGVVIGVDEQECKKELTKIERLGIRNSPRKATDSDDLLFPIEEVDGSKENIPPPAPSIKPKLTLLNKPQVIKPPLFRPAVEVTPMSYLPNAQIERYLGNVNLFFIRESLSIREDGGLNVFMQVFLAEAQAILRAHVKALGGNALVSYQLNEIVLLDNPHKHQGQCLLNVCGDAVEVSYEDDSELGNSFGRSSPCKTRSISCSEVVPNTPVRLVRQRSVSETAADTE
ncbi:C2 domain-containing protein 5 isoform X2 [Nematostella vectensis]|uniref:C2 domain-containing protein 5 isoform X2 n=1 Tax=Nematostella vectensis TaxID=45351 RepID=UPI00139049A6|nr:C2 domain-containing protein 5 isoform X2 [Nematostella vectensis]